MTKKVQHCESCGAHALVETWQKESFLYGSGPDAITLSVNVPVLTCKECGFSVTGGDAESLRHEAVCVHLGRLTPDEIRAIRESNNLTQEQFANITGFGVASIKRWESAYQIQNLSADRYLRLLRIPQNLQVIRLMSSTGNSVRPVFRTTLSERIVQDSRSFRLRATSSVVTVQ